MGRLFEDMMETCTHRESDGASFSDGETFRAAIVRGGSYEARIAESKTGGATFTITSDEPLEYHSVFVDSYGNTYRVTGISQISPAVATFTFYQNTAELWDEPE